MIIMHVIYFAIIYLFLSVLKLKTHTDISCSVEFLESFGDQADTKTRFKFNS